VIYENVPGKILSKQNIVKNGYKGIEVVNKTRRGDYQRYNIFVTPFEIVLFKMSGNGEYVKEGKEADQFFNSIQFKNYDYGWKKWSPSFGGFEVDLPHTPVMTKDGDQQFMAYDGATKTAFEIIRTEVHNYDFVEEDTFDLGLMDESFGASEFIYKQLSRKQTKFNGFPALDVKYKYKDGSVALVKYLIHGTHYYTLIAHSKTENAKMNQFLNSFSIKPFIYPQATKQTDTSLYFTVVSPVPLEKTKKLSMYPDEILNRSGYGVQDDDAALDEQTTYKSKLVKSDSTGERIYISFSKPSRYYFDEDTTTVTDSLHFKTDRIDWTYRSRKKYELPNKTKVFEYVLGDPRSSRYVQGKLFTREGVSYRLETQGDTITKQSPFITGFFETFTPSDTVKGTNIKERKTALFFQDFFSKDTTQHKRAVRNVHLLHFDSTDFPQLKKAIGSLTWKEKKYLDVKRDFLWQLSFVKTKESADYLKNAYYAAGDTIDLQYTALEGLLQQKTAYAYQVFKDIMINEPPVLDVKGNSSTSYNPGRRSRAGWPAYAPVIDYGISTDYDYDNNNGSFLDDLSDSLLLTKTIFKDLLPLINLNDYEQPMMDLMGTLIDSSMITASDYEMYGSKFLLEAKQLLKKQIISEKNKQIEKAQETDEEKIDYYGNNNNDKDYGNNQLSLYATLLMPLWDANAAVPQLINQLLKSSDKRLKYNTTMLLLRNKKQLPDTMFKYFAAMDEYRYELYADLKEQKLLNLFPVAYNNHIDLAKSKLLSMKSYNKPDTIVFVERIAVQQKDRSGFVYFFKYKQKKDDNNWKLASVGLVPTDPKQFSFDKKLKYYEEQQYDFTELKETKIDNDTPLKEQIRKALKKMQYSKRNSAAEFYQEGEEYGMNNYFKNMRFKD
jgi:hypothetical protein